MFLENIPWADSRGDSMGRNAFAYICWPNESRLKDSIMQCVKLRDDGYIQIYRYPGFGGDTVSRDHVGAMIIALYVNRDFDELEWVLSNLPWKLSRKYSQTIDFWLWLRSIKNKNRGYFFLLLTLIQFMFVVLYNAAIRKIIGIKKATPPIDHKPMRGWKKLLAKTLYPHYALFLLSWQIRILPASIIKRIVQRLLRIESNNIVIDAILGRKILKVEYESYRPTTSFIWSRRMDTNDDVMIRPMTDAESKYNDLNQAMLDYLYFGVDSIMIGCPDEIVRSIKEKNQLIFY